MRRDSQEEASWPVPWYQQAQIWLLIPNVADAARVRLMHTVATIVAPFAYLHTRLTLDQTPE